MAFGIDDAIAAGLKILDKFIPDPAAKAAAALEVMKMKQAGEFKELDAELQMAQAQADINKVEAGSANWFVSSWRPLTGYVCAFGFGIEFVVGPMLEWGSALAGHPIKFPTLDGSTLTTLLMGMLGLGTLRTVERVKGVVPPQSASKG